MKTTYITKLLSGFILCILCTHGVTAQQEWTKTSTTAGIGGTVYALEAIGNYIFAGTSSGGVFFSDDNGNTWINRNGAFPNMKVRSMAVHGTTIFVGTNGAPNAGIYQSSDNGLNWTDVTQQISNNYFYEVGALTTNGTHLFAGTSEGVLISSLNNVSPTSWSLYNHGLSNQSYRRIGTLKIKGNIIYAGLYGFGVWTSATDSAYWTDISSNMPDNLDNILALDITSSTMFAGNLVLFRSSDNGVTWTQPNQTIFNNKFIYAISSRANEVYVGTEGAGVFLSTDQGNTWISYNQGFLDNQGNWLCNQINVRAMLLTNTHIFVGTDCGVWRRSLPVSGTNEIRQNNFFTLYPNPAAERCFIQPVQVGKVESVTLSDVNGKQSPHLPFLVHDDGTIEIALDNYRSGIYFVHLTTTTTHSVIKLVKE